MDKGWRPIAELRPGQYAVGLLADWQEVDIYRAGADLLNVATGAKVEGVTEWRLLRIRDRNTLDRLV